MVTERGQVLTAGLVSGDHVSCSRLGGSLRSTAARLVERRMLLERLAGDVSPGTVPAELPATLQHLSDLAGELDRAGALLQRYATDLAQAHEQARRVERAVQGAGLQIRSGRVVEPHGPSDSAVAAHRRDLLPELQARVERISSSVGRSRGTLERGSAVATAAIAEQAGLLRGIPAGRRRT